VNLSDGQTVRVGVSKPSHLS